MPPHTCAPGPSKSCVVPAPIMGIHMDNVPSSSSPLIFGNGGVSGFLGSEGMDVGPSYDQPFGGSSFRSQSLGQISQPLMQPRFQPHFHLQPHSTAPHLLRLSQQRPSSSGIQDVHQQHPLYQQLPGFLAHRHHINQQHLFQVVNHADGEDDSEQEGIVMAVAAAGVGNSSGGSGEELMHVDDNGINNSNEDVAALAS